MKRLLLTFTCIVGLAGWVQAGVKIELDAGVLRTATGATFTGGLLQLIASRAGPNGTFVEPTPTSFTGGSTDNVVIATFTFNQGGAGFVTGETDNLIPFTLENTTATPSPTTFDAGDALLLRWYPTLTTAATAPGLGTSYGEYRSSTGANGSLPWVAPSDGKTITLPSGLIFLTTTAGGSNPDSAGNASNFVLAGGVPEPSTYATLAGAAMAFGAVRALQRRRTASSCGLFHALG